MFLVHLISSPPHTILFLGDSVTAGYGLREEQAYPALLEDGLKKHGIDCRILNGGVSGDTTGGGLRRLPWMVKNSSPTLVIIALGGNDMLRGLPVDQIKSNLTKMITFLKQKNISVLLLGIKAPGNLGASYVSSFDKVFDLVSKEMKVPLYHDYIRSVAGKTEFNLRDGIHPTAEGQQLIANDLIKFILPFLAERKVK